MFSENLTKVIR